MNLTKKEYSSLELVYVSRTAEFRRKDDFLLKKYIYSNPLVKSKFDYLLFFPHIDGSGELLDELFIGEFFQGIVTKEFKDAVPFSKGKEFSITEKIKACLDINRQLSMLHSYNMCFNDMHIDNLLIDKSGGHLIDFDEIDYFGGSSYSSKYRLVNSNGSIFSGSFKVDLYKSMICYLSLFYNIDLEKLLKYNGILNVSIVPYLFENTSIGELVSNATKNMFTNDKELVPNIKDFLPFILDEERFNYDLDKIKKKVKR